MNEDLAKERRQTTFNVEELTAFLFGGKENLDAMKYLEPLIVNDPVFDNSKDYFLQNEELNECSAKRAVHFVQKQKELNLAQYSPLVNWYISNMAAPASVLMLHQDMFTNTVKTQGNDEQVAKWMPLMHDFKIIGTYAQTEMGHGTNIRELETTATYNPKSQSFILNSPTLTAMKWWPGSLAHTVTHAVVFARLITRGKDHGVHGFIVQLRSLEDHHVLPGVKLGFIGPKFGANQIDNGFARFNNVILPRESLLMRYVQVSPEGHYKRTTPSSGKIAYIAMVSVRAAIAFSSSLKLAKACTIAIRYSAVRRQGKLNASKPEVQVLDYKTQQYSLFPLLATSFAFWTTGNQMTKMYYEITAEISQGNFTNANELHATSSGIKAFTTETAAAGVEECRFRCGGHGYSLSSGLPKLYAGDAAPACTYEGENIVMFLQTARYLMKCCTLLASGSSTSPAVPTYLSSNTEGTRCTATTLTDLRNPLLLVNAFSHRAERMVKLAFNNIQKRTSMGMSPEDAWNDASIDLVKAARAHCHLYVVRMFAKGVEETKFSDQLRSVMRTLFNLYAIHGIVVNAGDFLADQYLNGRQMNLVNDLLRELLHEIRPNAVGLVDGFYFNDHILNSVLGRYDGNVYEHLMKWAEMCPSNRQEVLPVYQKYLRPLLKGELQSKL